MKSIILLFLFFCLSAYAQTDTDTISQRYDLAGLTIEKLKKGDKIKLDNLIFVGGLSLLKEESLPLLEELLRVMQDNPSLVIEIQGHVCCYPDRKNPLSKRRAKVVYDYLLENGIEEKRISYKDFGGRKPIYPMPEENEEQRNTNRRVEIEILSN